MMMSCLEFALWFNKENPDYPIYYDGDHVINLHKSTPVPGCYLPLTDYSYTCIRNSFATGLSRGTIKLLEKYYLQYERNSMPYPVYFGGST